MRAGIFTERIEMAQLRRFNPPTVKVEGSFKRLSPISEGDFLLRFLERPEFRGPQGEKGDSITGAQGERGPMGLPGVAGRDGRDGESIVGPQGRAGAVGARGSRWFSGKGRPKKISGFSKGDYYLDTENGDVYVLE